MEGQRILNRHLPQLQEAVERTLQIDMDKIGISGCAWDIRCMQHQWLYARYEKCNNAGDDNHMKMEMTPEEHARLHRRRGRQALGLLIAVLVLIGTLTVLHAGVSAVAKLFDDTAQRQEYEDKLEGLVLFDPVPFDGSWTTTANWWKPPTLIGWII